MIKSPRDTTVRGNYDLWSQKARTSARQEPYGPVRSIRQRTRIAIILYL